MKKPDFDFTKHIEVPDEWIEKALSIPAQHPVKARPPIPRRLITAAAAVLVIGLSIGSYFLFRNMSQAPAVAPSPTSAPISPTLPGQDPTGIGSQTQPTEQTDAPQSESVPQPTELPTVTQTQPVPSVIPTQPATQQGAKPDETPTTVPVPTEPVTQPVTLPEPIDPEPIDEPTPTDALGPFEPYLPGPEDDPPEPVDPEPVPAAERFAEIYHPVSLSDYTESDAAPQHTAEIYCTLYDSSGNPLGSANPFANDHRAWIHSQWGDTFFYYFFHGAVDADADVPLHCTYVFYDRSGSRLAEGAITL